MLETLVFLPEKAVSIRGQLGESVLAALGLPGQAPGCGHLSICRGDRARRALSVLGGVKTPAHGGWGHPPLGTGRGIGLVPVSVGEGEKGRRTRTLPAAAAWKGCCDAEGWKGSLANVASSKPKRGSFLSGETSKKSSTWKYKHQQLR